MFLTGETFLKLSLCFVLLYFLHLLTFYVPLKEHVLTQGEVNVALRELRGT